jgi:hypothetical protein
LDCGHLAVSLGHGFGASQGCAAPDRETNSNHGQVFVFWDHLFGSNSGRAGDLELLQPVLPQHSSPQS